MKPRLLFLSSRAPFPLHGGDAIRAFHLMRALSEEFEIHLIALTDETVDAEAVRSGLLQPAGPCSQVELHHLPRYRSVARGLAAWLTGAPIQIGYYRSSSLRRRILALQGEVDAVACHLVRMAPYAELLSVPRLLEYTDALSMFYERVIGRGDAAVNLKSLVYRIEQPRILRYEVELARRFDVLSFAGQADQAWLAKHSADVRAKAITAPNGVEAVEWHGPASAEAPDFVFLGNMRTLQNQDAIFWFNAQVMPVILQVLPAARLKIVGHCPDEVVQQLSSSRHVDLLGVVDDLGAVMRRALCGICPMRLGAGIQNKVLDYMNHGLPVISSALGAAGLGHVAAAGVTHLQAETPEEWKSQVEALLANALLRDSLAREGRALVERHFTWQANLAPLVETFARTCKQRMAASQPAA